MKRRSIDVAPFVGIGGVVIIFLMPGVVRGQEKIKPSLSIAGHEGYVEAVAFSPDGKTLAAASVDIRLFDSASGKPLGEFAREISAVNDVLFSPDGKRLISASGGGDLERWDLSANGKHESILTSASGSITAALSPDGTLVALNYSERLTFAGDSLVLWDLAGGREKHVLESGTKARAWSFSPDGKSLVAGYPDGKLDFWDVSTGKVRSTASAWPDVEIRGLAYSSDGRFLVIEPSESDAKGAKIWDVKANREDSAIAGDDDLDMPTYSPDGRYIAAMRRNRIVLWDAATKDVKYVLTGGSLRALACFAFSADSTMVAAGTTYTVRPLKNARVLVWKLSELK